MSTPIGSSSTPFSFRTSTIESAGKHAVTDEDVVLPVALEDAGDVAHVLADEADERAEVVLRHLGPRLAEAVAAHAIEVDPSLPVGPGRAVDATRLELVRLAEEAEVHALAELGHAVALRLRVSRPLEHSVAASRRRCLPVTCGGRPSPVACATAEERRDTRPQGKRQ